jgi:hypothetical protein
VNAGSPARAPLRGPGRSAAIAALVASVALAGCRGKRLAEDEHAPAPPTARTSSEEPPPVDRALPGELAEGTQRAFGLALPRVMTVKGRFDDVVFAACDAPADQVANYVRHRVTTDKIVTGPEKTVFTRATVRGHPGTLVAISVVSYGNRTELEVRDVTPKQAQPGLSSDDRWRELGLTPEGDPIDPTHLH